MRIDRLVGFALIFIGTLALFGRTTGAGLRIADDSQLLDGRQERFDAASLRSVRLEVEAGSLVVMGNPDSSEVSCRAEFHGPDASSLPQLELTHSQRGDRLVIRARTGRSKGRIDLHLRIPSGLDLEVDDGSGSIRIESVDGRVSIDDGSGSITLADLGGGLRLSDGSGSIRAERVRGSVRIDDGSGSILLREADGDVEISDGSGSISVHRVAGDVVVRDGSGSIQVRDVDGRFHLASDGSGSVSASGIRDGVQGRL